MPTNRTMQTRSAASLARAKKTPLAAATPFNQNSSNKSTVSPPVVYEAETAVSKLRAGQLPPPPPRFVFKPEVLDRVGVSYVSIWQWMREGKFPCSREVGGKVAWLESEIDEWMETRPLRKYKNAEAM